MQLKYVDMPLNMVIHTSTRYNIHATYIPHTGWAPGTLAIAVYVSPLMLSAWFGRFLILQLSSVGNVVVINLLQVWCVRVREGKGNVQC